MVKEEEEEEEEKGASAATTDVSEMHVVDMCATPGRKTCQLLSFGFRKVTAVEADARRCRRLRENLERLGHGGVKDGGDVDEDDGRVEVVVAKGQD